MGGEAATFRELAETGVLTFGDGYRTRADELGSSGFPILRVAQVADGRILTESATDHVRFEFHSQIGEKLSREGDIVLTTKGTFGRRAIVDTAAAGYVYSPQVCYFRILDHDELDPAYLYYWLGSTDFLHQARARKSQTDMADYLSLRDLNTICIRLPLLEHQRQVAQLLSTLDAKIELNRQMSEELETMARALFKSWFVDFEPVRAKAEGRDTGLPQSLADLFPYRFVASELGEIPEGWEVETFGDAAAQLREGVNPQKSPGTLFHHFSIPAYDDEKWPKSEAGESIKSVKSRVPAGAVLLSKLNPEIERVWLVDVQADDRAICSTEFIVLVPREPLGRSYVYCLARSSLFRQELEGLVTGTSKSHQRAQVGAVLALQIVRPPDALLRRFENVAESLLARSLVCRREAHTLTELRDTLLPKLVSGELRIDDAEAFIGRVA